LPYRVEDFRTGDITVTPVLDGFMLGRVLTRSGPGPSWTALHLITDEMEALREAVARALRDHTRVWFQEGPGQFRLVETNAARLVAALPATSPRPAGH
jgi:hypothetical protein